MDADVITCSNEFMLDALGASTLDLGFGFDANSDSALHVHMHVRIHVDLQFFRTNGYEGAIPPDMNHDQSVFDMCCVCIYWFPHQPSCVTR
jgi:hypothetical protein